MLDITNSTANPDLPTTPEPINQSAEMTIEEVRELMEASQTETEWNANCDKVKRAHNGYPSFWFREIIQSGLAGRVTARFGRDDRVHIQTIAIE